MSNVDDIKNMVKVLREGVLGFTPASPMGASALGDGNVDDLTRRLTAPAGNTGGCALDGGESQDMVQDIGQCGCQSWDCQTCFPGDEVVLKIGEGEDDVEVTHEDMSGLASTDVGVLEILDYNNGTFEVLDPRDGSEEGQVIRVQLINVNYDVDDGYTYRIMNIETGEEVDYDLFDKQSKAAFDSAAEEELGASAGDDDGGFDPFASPRQNGFSGGIHEGEVDVAWLQRLIR